MGHRIADVDSFGAAVGIYCAARVLGKPAHIVIDEVTSSLRPIKECFTKENGYPEDLCITSETALHKVDSRTLVMGCGHKPSKLHGMSGAADEDKDRS